MTGTRLGWFAALVVAWCCGCQLTTHPVGGVDGGRQRLYVIPEEQAFTIARSALEQTFPDAAIVEVEKEPLRYRARGYAATDALGRLEVTPLRFRGLGADGSEVAGYAMRVRSQSFDVFAQRSDTEALSRRVTALLEDTGTGVSVSEARRIGYESESRGPTTSAGEATHGLPARSESPRGDTSVAASPREAPGAEDPQASDVPANGVGAEEDRSGAAFDRSEALAERAPPQPGWRTVAACFLVRRDGTALTVVRRGKAVSPLRVRLSNGEVFDGDVARTSGDLAVLRVETTEWTPHLLPIAAGGREGAGSPVFSFRQEAVIEGVLDLVDEASSGSRARFSWPDGLPDPGSPIVNERGEAVAIASLAPGAASHLVDEADDLFPRPLSVGRVKSREEAIHRARQALCRVEVRND